MYPIRQDSRLKRGLLFTVALLGAGALKLHYSVTSVNGLRWILAPTTFLVELATGQDFKFEPYAGYMSSDHSFLIAASCSGVNFMIAAFLMLLFERLWRERKGTISWLFLPVAAIAAYITTVVANTFRISTAMLLRHTDPEVIWLNPNQLHRFEGIFIYFGFLLLLFMVSKKIGADDKLLDRKRTGLLRRSVLPLFVYYVTTLAIPLANGSYLQGGVFWEHALFVILTPLLLLLPISVIDALWCRRMTST